MRGVSRASLAEVEERLGRLTTRTSPAAATLADELFAVAGVLASQPALRRALTDPSSARPSPDGPRAHGAVRRQGQRRTTVELVGAVAAARWSASGDLTDAVEQLAVQAIVAAADRGPGSLDDLEDELFRFGRIVASQPELRIALTQPVRPGRRQAGAADRPAGGQGDPETLRLITEAAAAPART